MFFRFYIFIRFCIIVFTKLRFNGKTKKTIKNQVE